MDWKFLIYAGGPVVLILIILLIIVIIIIVERYIFFLSYKNHLNEIEKILTYTKIQDLKNIEENLDINSEWLSIFRELSFAEKLEENFLLYIQELQSHWINQQLIKLEKYLTILASLGNLSPFIGLLGTVFGIIRSFMHLGETNITEINKGIAEALIATALGLIVAIPSSFAYNFFRKEIDNIILKIETIFNIFKLKVIKEHEQLSKPKI